jgi:hypothetical protein
MNELGVGVLPLTFGGSSQRSTLPPFIAGVDYQRLIYGSK